MQSDVSQWIESPFRGTMPINIIFNNIIYIIIIKGENKLSKVATLLNIIFYNIIHIIIIKGENKLPKVATLQHHS